MGNISVRVGKSQWNYDWLCYKMEGLNTRGTEGYPSLSQESAGLKVDQFIQTPKSRAKWYCQSRIRQDTPHRPGKTSFRWSGSEARLNAQFSRLAKVSAYPQSGPPPDQYPRRFYTAGRNVPGRGCTLLIMLQDLITAQAKSKRKWVNMSLSFKRQLLYTRHLKRLWTLLRSSRTCRHFALAFQWP